MCFRCVIKNYVLLSRPMVLFHIVSFFFFADLSSKTILRLWFPFFTPMSVMALFSGGNIFASSVLLDRMSVEVSWCPKYQCVTAFNFIT